MPLKVGEVGIPDDEDFQVFKQLCDIHDDWTTQYNKNGISVWTRETDEASEGSSSVKMFKVYRHFGDIKADVMYDVLHDPDYRKVWDKQMIEGKEMYMLNPNNDIGYYLMKCPSPIKNRDFLMQRSWLETGSEYIIFNHSVFHKDMPPKKGVVRGESLLTGYLVRPTGTKSCEMTYVSQSDPKGSLPKWVINKLAQFVAPKIMQRLYKAALKYPAWKAKHRPQHKPWIYPEQMLLPRLDFQDLRRPEDFQGSAEEEEDEGAIQECDFTQVDLDQEFND